LRTLDSSHQSHQPACENHADGSAAQGEKQSFEKKVEEDIAVGRAQSFAQADLMRALADRDQHDVDDADGTQRERDHPDRAQEHVHDIEDGADHLRFLNRIPLIEGVLIGGVESVIAADNLMNRVQCEHMVGRH
jgi:hypothetical protein